MPTWWTGLGNINEECIKALFPSPETCILMVMKHDEFMSLRDACKSGLLQYIRPYRLASWLRSMWCFPNLAVLLTHHYPHSSKCTSSSVSTITHASLPAVLRILGLAFSNAGALRLDGARTAAPETTSVTWGIFCTPRTTS